MSQRRVHLLEKIQVQLAAVAALAVTYFLLWPVIRPVDPREPFALVPTGSYGTAAMFAATLWGLAALCALVTIGARAEGALLAALIGAGGVSLRSAPIRPLLWTRTEGFARLYGHLAREVLLMVLIAFVGMFAVAIVRWLVSRLRPRWLWRNPLLSLPPAGDGGPSSEQVKEEFRRRGSLMFFLLGEAWAPLVASASRRAGQFRRSRRDILVQAAGFLVLAGVIAAGLLLVLMQSSERGQIIFALFASFMLAVLISHQILPTALAPAAWLLPMAMALGYYVLAALTISATGPQAWMAVPSYAQALPVDWLTAGAGGALLGYWTSWRVHELRHIEGQEEQQVRTKPAG